MMRSALIVLMLACSSPAFAQAQEQEPGTRADALRREREDKAEAMEPAEPNPVERFLIAVENDRLLERLVNPPEGFYPKIGNVTTGSGMAFGPAYRRPALLGGHADFNASALASFDKYWAIDARLTMPRLADERVLLEVGARLYDYPQEDFFGLGPNSLREHDVSFGMKDFEVTARGTVKPLSWLSLHGSVAHISPTIRGEDGDVDAEDDDHPSIDDLFGEAGAPGFLEQPDFIRTSASIDLNYRQPRGNPRKGGRYMLTVERFDDRTLERFGFTRVEVDLQQYINLYKDRRVIALRGLGSFSSAEDGQIVPFYLQRTLGGPDDLRGFRRFRFRDRNLLLLQAEYRWEIFTAVDGAIFYDAGAVAPTREELRLGDLESDYGIGFRFGSANGVFLRVEGAFGSSGGKHFILRFGHVF